MEDVTVPKHEDKEGLLEYAYDAKNQISKDDIKYMLPAVINAVHLFADGNGRTSRITHLLLKEYSSKEEFINEIKKAVGISGRLNSFNIDPGIIDFELERIVLEKHGWRFENDDPNGKLGIIERGVATAEIERLDQGHQSYKKAKRLLSFCSDNATYVLTVIHILLGDEGIQNIMNEYNGNKRISPKKMLDILKPEDWENMLDNFYKLKKEQVEALVDIFIKPEEFIHKRETGETLKDFFERKIGEKVV
ncbi:MAG: hypothetical protein EXS49_00980 [Candidatus Pacebacteria bacterium]|nr:hypothetical protein [Candidatus Paceibacterota bacterium]